MDIWDKLYEEAKLHYNPHYVYLLSIQTMLSQLLRLQTVRFIQATALRQLLVSFIYMLNVLQLSTCFMLVDRHLSNV